METRPYCLTADEVIYRIDATLEPRLKLTPPAEIIVDTLDARGGKLRCAEDVDSSAPDYRDRFPRTNPATGPIAIDGAEPGNVLNIEILDIALDDHGFTLAKPGFGVFSDMVDRPVARLCRVVDGAILFGHLRLPVRPMIGVMATASAGEPRGTAHVGSHGGNIDCNLITIGSQVHLPVNVPGALLFVGDVHAAMGDGEISGTGLEIAAKVRLRLTLDTGPAIAWPWLETKDLIVTLGSGSTFERASDIALDAMLNRLVQTYSISEPEAYMLMSVCGDLRVNQACRSPVDTSVRFEFPKLRSS